jgi:inner membrane protein
MASAFSHPAAALALGQAAPRRYRSDWRFWYLAVLLSILPDVDVIGFKFGIRYDSMWGHRGFTHSLLAAALLGLYAALRLKPGRELWKLALLLSLIAASHGLLDGCTDGGRGVAFYAPFSAERYFLPWTPIRVSPIGAARFFTERGKVVILSELKWIWAPCAVLGAGLRLLRRD